MLLLDTTILSARAKIRPPAGLRSWLEQVADLAQLCVCFPVLIEIRRGLHLSKDPETAARVRKLLEDIEQSNFAYLGLGRKTEDIYARMMSHPALKNFWHPNPKAKHQRVSHDLMVAAVAITYEAPILTADGDFAQIHRHFELPGVYNPLKNRWLVAPSNPIELPKLNPDGQVPRI